MTIFPNGGLPVKKMKSNRSSSIAWLTSLPPVMTLMYAGSKVVEMSS